MMSRLEEILLKISQFFKRRNRWAFSTIGFFSAWLLVGAAALSVSAQSGAMSPYQGESDGLGVGGKWIAFRSEDKMTGAKRVRFELLSDNYLSEDPDYKPRIELVCTDGKYTSADFNPGIRLGPPNRPGFWGQPQMEVLVRVDDTHNSHGWNWNHDRFLSMDKGTTRELIGARVFKIQIPGRRGPEIAEFSPAGLDLARVKQACDLTPRKASKD
jgi:dipeptidyl aminopeptidase/acylaminoacyl peptidase